MKKVATCLFLTIVSIFIQLFTCCTNTAPATTVTDIDGNVYPTVTIGNKVWMAANLQVSRYRNGDAVPLITDSTTWRKSPIGGRCYYKNDTTYSATLGFLYNWYAVTDSRKIAPEGWHIPTDEEVKELITGLEKEPTNVNIFKTNGLGGYRYYNGISYHTRGFNGYWWAANRSYEVYDWSSRLYSALADVQRNNYEASYGLAIRCVKD